MTHQEGLTESTCRMLADRLLLLLDIHANETGDQALLNVVRSPECVCTIRYQFIAPSFSSSTYKMGGQTMTQLKMQDCKILLVTLVCSHGRSSWRIEGPEMKISPCSETPKQGEEISGDRSLGTSTKDLLRLDRRVLTDKITLLNAKQLVARSEQDLAQLKTKLVEKEREAWAKRIQGEITQLLRQSVPSKLFDEQAAISYAEDWITERLSRPVCPLEDLKETQLLGIVQGYKTYRKQAGY